jgi:hypothetical protein
MQAREERDAVIVARRVVILDGTALGKDLAEVANAGFECCQRGAADV